MLADSMAEYFCNSSQLASEAVELTYEIVSRLRAGAFDDRTERFHDQTWREVGVSGFFTLPMLERLGWALGGPPLKADAPIWKDYLACCLPGFEALRIPLRHGHGEGHIVQDMIVGCLRDDESEDCSVTSGIHSYRVWCKALAIASRKQCAPEVTSKIKDALGVVGGMDGNEVVVQKAFKQWDPDGSGTISQLELSCILRSLDTSLSFEAIETLFRAADTNRDGGISYKEFIAWLFGGEGMQPLRPAPEVGAVASPLHRPSPSPTGARGPSRDRSGQRSAPGAAVTPIQWESMTLSSALR